MSFGAQRKAQHVYLDPLDAIWLTVAWRVGFRVERSSEVYASTDGTGLMLIGDPATLDPDDCLAQMILHELCHSLIEGSTSLELVDFGLDNLSDRDAVRERACLRLQAWLTAQYGLRHVLAPTTDFRELYDQLPAEPFAGQGDDAIEMARQGAVRSTETPWAPHLQQGLRATARILAVAAELGAGDPACEIPPIWSEYGR